MITPLDILSLETWLLILSVLALIRFYIHRKWQFLKGINVSHEPPSILGLGNLMPIIKNQDVFFTEHAKMKKKYGSVYGSYFWLTPTVTMSDPEDLKRLFIKDFSSFPIRDKQLVLITGKEMNCSLVFTKGERWKRIRTTLTPTFSSSKLKEMFGIIEQCAEQSVKTLSKIAENKEGRFHARKLFGRLSMNVICSTAFSADVHAEDMESEDDTPKIVKMAQKLVDLFNFEGPIVNLCLVFPWFESIIAKVFGYSMLPKEVTDYFRRLTEAVIASKNNLHEKQRVDLMQLMLNVEIPEEDVKQGETKGITRNEIIGNSLIMILAGYETTATSMSYLAYNLATHKDVQRRVQQEIEDIIEEYGSLTYESVTKMKYLEMCIQESLRLYPLFPVLSRVADKDVTISGIHIKKGMSVFIPSYELSHDQDYFDEPYTFKPERMEDMSKIDPMFYHPFGAGPRNCIGMRLAMLEIKIGFCKLLQEFDLDVCDDTPPPPLKVTFKMSMVPKEEVFLKVIKRN